ncbi:DUF3800 domain-containing protein [Saccharopolyspora endophytica]|uniref:DUF3800 domain-containing protein n=1 Tax=Saccharopolyspora endophytica TaxID=543886 RepID=A0ABS5DI03_9PSEU|nr:DUF3800 domain-containing protein [Saccharopolyspora endophytica]MBQ0925919.1 DUF3800 domain-containing protein [Saccharopolyspora endophytica]
MADVYMYIDETGNLDLPGKHGSSKYFGFATATFIGDHSRAIWEGMQLRLQLESEGVSLPHGLHAKDDHDATRRRFYDLISSHKPRIETTLLLKKNAYPAVLKRMAKDEMHLYHQAWYLHFQYQARFLLSAEDKVYVIAATLSDHKRKQRAARQALERVCNKFNVNLTLCTWDSRSSWGLQVADYGAWAVQRKIRTGSSEHYNLIEPLLYSVFRPWEPEQKTLRPAVEFRSRKAAERQSVPLIEQRAANYPEIDPQQIPKKYWDASFQELAMAEEEAWLEQERADEWWELDNTARDDPDGVGLWGRALWSDDDPWDEAWDDEDFQEDEDQWNELAPWTEEEDD